MSLRVKSRSNAGARAVVKKYKEAGYDCDTQPNSGSDPRWPGDGKSVIDLWEYKSEQHFDVHANKMVVIRRKDVEQIMREAAQEKLPWALHFKAFKSQKTWTLFQWVSGDLQNIRANEHLIGEDVRTTPHGNIRVLEKDLDPSRIYAAHVFPDDFCGAFFSELSVYLSLKEMHEGRVERNIMASVHYMS